MMVMIKIMITGLTSRLRPTCRAYGTQIFKMVMIKNDFAVVGVFTNNFRHADLLLFSFPF